MPIVSSIYSFIKKFIHIFFHYKTRPFLARSTPFYEIYNCKQFSTAATCHTNVTLKTHGICHSTKWHAPYAIKKYESWPHPYFVSRLKETMGTLNKSSSHTPVIPRSKRVGEKYWSEARSQGVGDSGIYKISIFSTHISLFFKVKPLLFFPWIVSIKTAVNQLKLFTFMKTVHFVIQCYLVILFTVLPAVSWVKYFYISCTVKKYFMSIFYVN